MRRALLAWIVLFCLGMPGGTAATCHAEDIKSEEELGSVVQRLADPSTEMNALGRLIRFAGLLLYQGGSMFMISGDQKQDDLRRGAVREIRAHWSFDSVKRALESDDIEVRRWGVLTFEVTAGKREPWKTLLPRLEELAARDDDANIRAEAIRRLGYYEKDSAAFLAARRESPDEKDPWVLQNLLGFDAQTPAIRARWYARAVQFLSDKDDAVRWNWLFYIYFDVWNESTAPMWRVEADPGLVAALSNLEKSGLPNEREKARETLQIFQTKNGIDTKRTPGITP